MATHVFRPAKSLLHRTFFPSKSIRNKIISGGGCSRRHVVTSSQAAISNIPPTRITVLDNGLRVATEERPLPTATVGIWFDAGSRYENDTNNGIANFTERMLFKGTSGKSEKELAMIFSDMGAHVEASTGRDETSLYVKCCAEDVSKAIEVLADMIVNTSFDESVIECERSKLLKDIELAEGDAESVVMDYLHATAYQGTPLAYSTLGTPDNIRSIVSDDISSYLSSHLRIPARMVVCGAGGGVQHDAMCELARKYFSHLTPDYPMGEIPVVRQCRYTGSEIRHTDDTMPFAYAAVAVETPGCDSPDTVALSVAQHCVGGWDVRRGESNLNVVRLGAILAEESPPLAHAYNSFMRVYRDTGLWGAYFVAPRSHADDFGMNLVLEWKRMVQSVTDEEVTRAKNQLKANLFLQLNGTTPACQQIGSHVLWHGRRIPLSEIVSRINAVDAETVHDVMSRYVFKAEPVMASTGAVENVTDYSIFRGFLHLTVL